MTYTIVASYEPNGEGNGFVDDCADEQAEVFFVYGEDDIVGAFETRAEAEEFIATLD